MTKSLALVTHSTPTGCRPGPVAILLSGIIMEQRPRFGHEEFPSVPKMFAYRVKYCTGVP